MRGPRLATRISPDASQWLPPSARKATAAASPSCPGAAKIQDAPCFDCAGSLDPAPRIAVLAAVLCLAKTPKRGCGSAGDAAFGPRAPTGEPGTRAGAGSAQGLPSIPGWPSKAAALRLRVEGSGGDGLSGGCCALPSQPRQAADADPSQYKPLMLESTLQTINPPCWSREKGLGPAAQQLGPAAAA